MSSGAGREIGRVRRDDLPVGARRRLRRPPYDVLLVNARGDFLALEDACPHSGASLCEGWLEGERVVCPQHGWVIDARDGHVIVPPGMPERSPTFAVRVEGEWVVVYEREGAGP